MTTNSPRLAVLGGMAASVVLLAAAPRPATSVRTLSSAATATDPTAPLVGLLALVAWAGAAYLLVVAALVLGGRLPGLAGRALRTTSRRCTPAVLRRALEVTLGATLVVGSLAGTASAATTSGPAPAVAGVVPAAAPPRVDAVPGLAAEPTHRPADAPLDPALDLDWPVAPATVAPLPAAPATSDAPAPRPHTTVVVQDAAAPARSTSAAVVVRPGDSLWSVTRDALGAGVTDAQVAATWPSWWQANREAVGDDPDLLHPGTRLLPPA